MTRSIGQMERAAGFAHNDTPQAKLNKLDAVLAQSITPPQDAALFAEMLSLPNDGRYPTLDLAPQQRRQRTLEALTAHMEALSRSNPVLMIFEDAHWTDPTSLEVFGRVVDRIRTLGVLLIVTYRLDFDAPWIGRPHVTALTLNRLGEREIAAMIDRVSGNKPLAARSSRAISEACRLGEVMPMQETERMWRYAAHHLRLRPPKRPLSFPPRTRERRQAGHYPAHCRLTRKPATSFILTLWRSNTALAKGPVAVSARSIPADTQKPTLGATLNDHA